VAQVVPFIVAAVVSTALSIALAWIVGPTHTSNYGDKLRLPDIQTSNYGIAITRLFGQARLAGNIIWQGDIVEEAVTTSHSISSGILKPSSTISNTTYLYYANFAVGICGHVIAGISRIWADDVLLYDVNSTASKTLAELGIVIYYGTETQTPSPLIESIEGVASHPAYRGLAYATLQRLPLQPYGNRIPRITFEVEGL
jgi:hypothetical protein